MARELGLNPRKFGSLANEQQEPWKRPLAEFIAYCYCKRFGRTTPENVQSLEDVVKRAEARRSERQARKTNRALLLTLHSARRGHNLARISSLVRRAKGVFRDAE